MKATILVFVSVLLASVDLVANAETAKEAFETRLVPPPLEVPTESQFQAKLTRRYNLEMKRVLARFANETVPGSIQGIDLANPDAPNEDTVYFLRNDKSACRVERKSYGEAPDSFMFKKYYQVRCLDEAHTTTLDERFP